MWEIRRSIVGWFLVRELEACELLYRIILNYFWVFFLNFKFLMMFFKNCILVLVILWRINERVCFIFGKKKKKNGRN